MADEQTGLEVLLQSILDSKGFDDLKAKLAESQSATQQHTGATDEATKSSAEFGSALGEVGTKLAEAAGELAIANEAFKFLKESILSAIEESRQLDQFARANELLAGATTESREANEAWLLSVEQASGKTKAELIPSYLRLVGVTQDVSQAQRISQIAAGASAAGFGDLGQITQALIKYYETGVAPMRGFGAVLRAQIGDAKDVGDGLTRLAAKFGDAGASVDNAGIKVDRAKVQWDEFKVKVGELALGLVDHLQPAFKLIAQAITNVISGMGQLGGYIGALASSIPSFFSGVREAMTGHFKVAGAIFKETAKGLVDNLHEVNAEAKATADRIMGVFNTTTENINRETSKIVPNVKKTAAEILKELRQRYADELEMAKVTTDDKIDLLNKEIEIHAKYAALFKRDTLDQARALYGVKQATKDLADYEIQADAERVARHDRIQAHYDADLKKEVAAEKKAIADRLTEEKDYVDKSTKSEIERTKTLLDLYQKDLAAFTGTEEAKAEIAKKVAELQARLAGMEAESLNATVNQSVDTLGNYFGFAKELAIAQAIMNTYQGVTAALAAPYPLDLILPEIVLAAGLADIATIAAQQKPSYSGSLFGGGTNQINAGFDEPSNDFAAYVGGQKWARDMVEQYSKGAAAGFSSQIVNNYDQRDYSTSSKTGDQKTVLNVHGTPLIDSGSDIFMRQFARKLQPYLNNLEASRTLR